LNTNGDEICLETTRYAHCKKIPTRGAHGGCAQAKVRSVMQDLIRHVCDTDVEERKICRENISNQDSKLVLYRAAPNTKRHERTSANCQGCTDTARQVRSKRNREGPESQSEREYEHESTERLTFPSRASVVRQPFLGRPRRRLLSLLCPAA
jgi:hypothetical protein